MKFIDVKLSLPMVAPLVDLMRKAGENLRDTLATPLRIEDIDPDFREVWTSELIEAQNNELDLFFSLFNKEFYSSGLLRIEEDKAEAVLRTCSGLRLELRRSLLSRMSDQTLEAGGVPLEELKEPERSAFLCYMFLATIQELMIENFCRDSGQAEED